MTEVDHEVTFSPLKVAGVLGLTVVVLTVLNLIAVILDYSTPRVFFADAFTNLFSTRREMNIPTWYSSFALLLCSALLGLIASSERTLGGRHQLHWTLLSVIFLYLAVDEGAAIHERVSQAASRVISLRGTGLFNFAWVVPAGILVMVFILAYARFVVALTARTRNLVLLAGATYIGGTLVSEMVSGQYVEQFGTNVGYELITTVEEFLEMVGVVIFVYALLGYMRLRAPAVTLRLIDPARAPGEVQRHVPE